jgi:hypothetical protein
MSRGGDEMSATQYNVRLPEGTAKQIQKLIESTGMTQTQLMIVAIDRMYQQEELNKMALQKAIETSENNAVIAEYNGMYTAIDGSLLDGNFSITTGVQGMPPTEHQEVNGIESAVKVIQEKGLLDRDWEPILGEDE